LSLLISMVSVQHLFLTTHPHRGLSLRGIRLLQSGVGAGSGIASLDRRSGRFLLSLGVRLAGIE
jgi:hypothetical protein